MGGETRVVANPEIRVERCFSLTLDRPKSLLVNKENLATVVDDEVWALAMVCTPEGRRFLADTVPKEHEDSGYTGMHVAVKHESVAEWLLSLNGNFALNEGFCDEPRIADVMDGHGVSVLDTIFDVHEGSGLLERMSPEIISLLGAVGKRP